MVWEGLIHVSKSGYEKNELLASDIFFVCRAAIFTGYCEFFNPTDEV